MVNVSRREVIASLLAATAGVGAGVGGTLGAQATVASPAAHPQPDTATSAAVDPTGRTQAGITRPATPQPFGLVTIATLKSLDLGWLRGLGAGILGVAGSERSILLPDGPGDVTVTVGLGPRLVASVDPTLSAAEPLPLFAKDEAIDSSRLGGDLLLAIYASNPTILLGVRDHLLEQVPHATVAWSQHCFRGPGTGMIARNPLGFRDGVIVPHGEGELNDAVWIDDGPFAGGTVCVIRRLVLNVQGFGELDLDAQQRTIGRAKLDGAPLSGGAPDSEVNLTAKTESGEYLVPAHSHVRRAHPSFTGSALMLRRGYAFDDGDGDGGLLFMCYQRDLHAFVATQTRLDEGDDLMAYARPTASASFVILPGFDETNPLGSRL